MKKKSYHASSFWSSLFLFSRVFSDTPGSGESMVDDDDDGADFSCLAKLGRIPAEPSHVSVLIKGASLPSFLRDSRVPVSVLSNSQSRFGILVFPLSSRSFRRSVPTWENCLQSFQDLQVVEFVVLVGFLKKMAEFKLKSLRRWACKNGTTFVRKVLRVQLLVFRAWPREI